jgi:hypothetical protein
MCILQPSIYKAIPNADSCCQFVAKTRKMSRRRKHYILEITPILPIRPTGIRPAGDAEAHLLQRDESCFRGAHVVEVLERIAIRPRGRLRSGRRMRGDAVELEARASPRMPIHAAAAPSSSPPGSRAPGGPTSPWTSRCDQQCPGSLNGANIKNRFKFKMTHQSDSKAIP